MNVKNEKKWIILYLLAVTLFTAYILLDTFVIPRKYQTVKVTDKKETASYKAADFTISEYELDKTVVHVAEIISNGPGTLQTAFAYDTFGQNIKAPTSEIAESHGAILAINGDFYGARSAGYVIRGGVIYRAAKSNRYDLVIYEDGHFGIVSELGTTPENLIADGAVDVFSFGPPLINQGKIMISRLYEAGMDNIYNSRTAIGITSDNHYIFVVTDGRNGNSKGLSIYQLAKFMKELGCECAYNLDGGGSATMYYNGEVINESSTFGEFVTEREVSDIVYIR